MLVTLRPVNPSDQNFLLELYANTRQEEIAAWGLDDRQKTALLQMPILRLVTILVQITFVICPSFLRTEMIAEDPGRP